MTEKLLPGKNCSKENPNILIVILVLFSITTACDGGKESVEDGGPNEDTSTDIDADTDTDTDADTDTDTDTDSDSDTDADTDTDTDADSDDDAGTECIPHPDTADPVLDPESYDECDLCDNAHCVPTDHFGTDIPESSYDKVPKCQDSERLRCVPDKLIETGGKFILKSCRSANNEEGRCVSLCVPEVKILQDYLPVDVCDEDERCAPCYNSATGVSMGTCEMSCDTGPVEAPFLFERCCNSVGACAPSIMVPANVRDQLGQDTCEAGELCAADDFFDIEYIPAPCDSTAIRKNETTTVVLEGRCMPDCIPSVATFAESGIFPQDICPEHFVCAACYSPAGHPTGACIFPGDNPVDPPPDLDKCCGAPGTEMGTCVAAEVFSSSPFMEEMLDEGDCQEINMLCIPNELMDPEYAPTTCESAASLEGRCMSKCIPGVQLMEDFFPTAPECESHQLCAACYSPSGIDLQSCTYAGDSPTDPPPDFKKCCEIVDVDGGIDGGVDSGTSNESAGTCVPGDVFPEQFQNKLAEGICDTGDLCVPNYFMDPSYDPSQFVCTSLEGFEGRCASTCLPEVSGNANRFPQDICPHNFLCATCYNPANGDLTGNCEVNGDEPNTDAGANMFSECCQVTNGEMRGVCVPDQYIPVPVDAGPGYLDQVLLIDSCGADAGMHCVFDKMAANPLNPELPICNAHGHCYNQDGIGIAIAQVGGVCTPECVLGGDAGAGPMPPGSTPGWQTADVDDDDCIENEEICAPCQFMQYVAASPDLESCDDMIYTDAGPVLPETDYSDYFGECYTGACGEAPNCNQI